MYIYMYIHVFTYLYTYIHARGGTREGEGVRGRRILQERWGGKSNGGKGEWVSE